MPLSKSDIKSVCVYCGSSFGNDEIYKQSAGDLAARFEISGPSMSHHFSVLKSADLVRVRRNGQQMLYSLNTTVVQDVLTTLFDLFHSGENSSPEAL